MSSLYVQCHKWFMVHTLIPFPVIMWRIYFRFSLILLATFDVNSHQWGKWLTYVLSDSLSLGDISLRSYNNSFEIGFSFGFWFGNNWLGLYTSSSFFSLGFVSNIHAVMLAMVGSGLHSATLNSAMALNLTSFCQLFLTSLKLALIWLILEHTLCLQQLCSFLAQYSVIVNNLGAHTMLGTVTILYRFTLFQPLYTCTWTNLRVTYSGQIRGWSESTLILTNESQPNITRLIRVDEAQVSKLSKTSERQTTDRQVNFMPALPCENPQECKFPAYVSAESPSNISPNPS
jgi:hypothetical protein